MILNATNRDLEECDVASFFSLGPANKLLLSCIVSIR